MALGQLSDLPFPRSRSIGDHERARRNPINGGDDGEARILGVFPFNYRRRMMNNEDVKALARVRSRHR